MAKLPHDYSLDISALAKQLVQLLLGGVKREISYVERGCCAQQPLLFAASALKMRPRTIITRNKD